MTSDDPAFASAVESAYLAQVARSPSNEPLESIHAELLAEAIYRADPTNGGLRFKKLPGASDLEARLFRALRNRQFAARESDQG